MLQLWKSSPPPFTPQASVARIAIVLVCIWLYVIKKYSNDNNSLYASAARGLLYIWSHIKNRIMIIILIIMIIYSDFILAFSLFYRLYFTLAYLFHFYSILTYLLVAM